MKYKICIMLLISIFCFNACDILRSSLFEVTSWTPGGGYHSQPDQITVSLTFSHEPNRASIERSFSLTGNGNRVRGNFLWEGKKILGKSVIRWIVHSVDFCTFVFVVLIGSSKER